MATYSYEWTKNGSVWREGSYDAATGQLLSPTLPPTVILAEVQSFISSLKVIADYMEQQGMTKIEIARL